MSRLNIRMKAAIYHFTDGSEKRPKICQDQLGRLKTFAVSNGFPEAEIFCDRSLIKCKHPEFERFLSIEDQFDTLIAKDFYHISKNTQKCMDIMRELKRRGVQVLTPENGSFSFEEAPLKKPLRAATYCCRFGLKNEMHEIMAVRNDALSLFARKETCWTIMDQYFDESEHQNNGEQPELMELIMNRRKYDILLVHSMNDIHWRTANFCRIREQLKLDIYSLREGFLKYEKEKGI